MALFIPEHESRIIGPIRSGINIGRALAEKRGRKAAIRMLESSEVLVYEEDKKTA
jgi:hypothetical protein